jgi:heme/copper-type cytochrome/quinol oxidase subunit 2
MKLFTKLSFAIYSLALAATPAFAQLPPAQNPLPPTGASETQVRTASDLVNLLTRIIGWVQVLFFTVAALFIILAAFQYLTSGGDAEKQKEARDKLVYAVIAIIIAALAFGVKSIVVSIVG